MSRLEELIEELCPNGVEYRKLGDICDILRGKRLTKSQLIEDGKYPVLHGGASPMGYYNEYNRKANTTVVVNTGNAGSVFFYDKKFWSSDACFSLYPHSCLLDRYLYHFASMCEPILKSKIRAGAMPTIDSTAVENLQIPVPPLDVQREIVRILDNFTEYTEELTEELTIRKQQYEYYLNVILNNRRSGWEKKTLKEIADVRDGTHGSPKQSDSGYKLATSKNISSGRLDLNTCYLISEKDYNEINLRSKVNQYDILFSMIGTVGDVVIIMDEPCFAIKNMGLIKTKGDLLLSKYIFYWLQSDFSKAYIQSNLKGTAPKYLSLALLRAFPIYIPTNASEMKKIVNIIDSFSNLSSDLEHGLPAEIESRQKQYAYYRDKLLTFKEIKA